MIKSLFLASAAVLMLASGVASAQEFRSPEVAELFVTADENYAKLGYNSTAWAKQWDDLGTGGSEPFTIRLDAGDAMSFLAVCGLSCTNLDMRVTDADGNEMGSDTKDDPFPIVGFVVPKEGIYTVQVIMVACPVKHCPIGVKAYEKK